MMEKTMSLLLDVMVDGRYYHQLKYPKRGFPTFIDGSIIEVHNLEDIKTFVEDKLPSLKGKKWSAIPTDQRV